jgi:glycosyltransferase involved in cell wall biosynthesis
MLQTGIGVIGNSRGTLHELRSFAMSEGLPRPPAIAALLGSDAVQRRRQSKSTSTHPTYLVLGTIEGRKNHLLLLNIWSRLVRQLGRNAPRLLIIGQRGWECDEVFKLLDRSELLKGAVVEISDCDDEALVDHLCGARALLFPSLAEGYGLPLVESLRLGVPVIASDLPVFRELAGEVPDYLDPRDQSAWERAIISYAHDPSQARASQLDRLKAFRAPTWGSHFATVDPWMTEL